MDWSPSAALETIKRERVTIIKTVPTVLMRLLDYPGIEDYDLSSLRTIIYGGSPMPLERLKKGIGLLGQVFVQSYGQAEAPMTIATLSKEDHVVFGTQEEVNRLASVGRPYTLVDVRVVDDDGDDVPLGELGEVIVSGDHIMKEYWHQRPEVTAETVKDGWVHTRDIGRLDENGYLYLIDRKSEMIITGGLNVYPAEVEQVLYSHPAVEIAAAIGVPDEEWGESIRVFIVLKPGILASEAELLEFCKQNMSSYKKPKSIEIRDSLPMSGAGKVARRELREAYWRGRQRAI
jgi:acyl-CoA synthetase (AMP-forming)/AMP-acid ligase II